MIGAIEGYLEGRLNLLWRFLLAVIGVLLVWPNLPIWIRLVCVALFIAIFIYSGKTAARVERAHSAVRGAKSA